MTNGWVVQGLYKDTHVEVIADDDWETLTYEETKADALAMARCYDENEPNIPHRIRPDRGD